MGSTIALDLSGLLGNDGGDVGDRGNREYGCSLFPGQIVALEGINPFGRTMRVTRVIEGVVPPTDVAADVKDVDDDDDSNGSTSHTRRQPRFETDLPPISANPAYVHI